MSKGENRVHWNYRVAHRPGSAVPSYGIYEVYYDEDYDIKMYSKNPISPFGDTTEELEADVSMMLHAFNETPLNLNHVDYMIRQKQKYKQSREQ
jgi:hypothetical protein